MITTNKFYKKSERLNKNNSFQELIKFIFLNKSEYIQDEINVSYREREKYGNPQKFCKISLLKNSQILDDFRLNSINELDTRSLEFIQKKVLNRFAIKLVIANKLLVDGEHLF